MTNITLLRTALLLSFLGFVATFTVGPVVLFPSSHPRLDYISKPTQQRSLETSLSLFRFFRRFRKKKEEIGKVETQSEVVDPVQVIETLDVVTDSKPLRKSVPLEDADIVVVGGGVSGLTAAITAADASKKRDSKIVLLEANARFGGRVMSDKTEDGYVLDEGFAVFIEAYPEAKKLFDYDDLKLKPFLPGALVKINDSYEFARVADPLREPTSILDALLAPIGNFNDKINVLYLVGNCRSKSVEELFEEPETDTKTALTERWGFSDDFISGFFKPFLEGIYLAPLSEQSSRMFSFVFKMFSEGCAMLPEGGMGKVAEQLVQKAQDAGVDLRPNMHVSRVKTRKDGSLIVECADEKKRFKAKSVIVAADGKMAQRILSHVDGFESLANILEQPQRSVGCLYYSFEGPAPVEEPILILNGIGGESGSEDYPVNNVCFPSVVNKGYAPEGHSLCSVTILGKAMEAFKGRPGDLDKAVRRQLGTWFQERASDIKEKWELKKIYFVSEKL